MARKKANDEPDKGKLSFNQSLKAPNSAELLKRLKTLHKELSEIEQDAIDTASLDKVAKELINSTLLLHKEKAVKAFLATCLVDILRLYAPEPPYTDVELRDVFQFLIRQLKNVGDPTDAHAPEYFYTLESLANVKSIVIICDLDQSEDMMTDVFKQSFDIISSSTSKNVELNIADMLVQILEEADPIPASVVDILLTQFLPKNAKMKPSAYSLVKEVCAAASDKLQRHVVQYFAEIITSTIGGDRMSSDDESDNEKGKSSKSKRAKLDNLPNDFVVAHSLIRQINRTVPDLLLSVVPLLEKELEEEKVEVRKLATETLVGMAGEKVGNGDLAKRHPQVWKSLVKRVLDVNPAVRLALIAGLSKVWKEHQSLSNDIELVLDRMLFDPDEKVRLASAQLFEELDFETAYNHVSVKMLKLLGERCQDRRAAVRSAALSALGRLYSLAYSDIESKDEKVIEHFGWIPATVIGVTSLSIDLTGQNALRHTVDRVLLKYILPLPDKDDEDQEWVDRFLCVYSSLPEDAQKLLLSQSRLAERRPNWWDVFIDACERNNGGLANDDQIKKQLDGAIHVSISRLPDQEKAKEALLKFAKANEKQLYKIMRTLMDVGTDVKTLVKNQKEALKRIEQISSTAVEPFTAFIYASSHFYINRSSITPLFKRLSTSKDDQSDEAFEILTYIAKNRPALFASHSAELTKAVSDGSSPRLSQVALHAAACLLRKAPAIKYSPDKKLSDRAKHYARNGNTLQSKHAATILALDKSRSASSAEVINDLSAKLSTASDGQLPGILAALARFARYDRVNFDAVSESVVKDVLEILHRPLKSSELVDEEDLAWFEDDELPERTKARELCLKVLTSHCLAYATSGDPEAAKTVSKPVFELLWKLMVQHEEGSNFNTPVAARLRLASSLAVLKLAPYPCFGTEISNHFLLLARMAQDMAFEVRYGYIHKLVNFFRSHYIKIPRYNMLLFLVAHDPEEDLRVEVESYVRHATSRLPDNARLPLWEHPFLRLIHLLAHHPDFAPDVAHDDAEELKVMAKYVQWYLELIATSQNISYLLHLSQIIKTMRDATDSDYDRNLYTMAELAQYLITQYAKTNSWPLETYPGEVKTPADVLRKIQDPAAAKRIASTAFIASDLLNDMSLGKTTVSAPKPAQRARAMESKPSKPRAPRKRSSPATTKPRSTKPRKKAGTKSDKWNPNASDEEDEISSPSEDENDENSGNPRKKSRSPLPPAKQGTRTGLRNGSANRRPGKVAVPQKMRVKDNPLEEGVSDSDAESMDADN